MRPRLPVFLLLLLLLAACRHPRTVDRGFYHWKSTLDLSPADSARMRRLGITRLFVHFCDVVPGPDRFPVTAARVSIRRFPSGLDIIPVVFLRNQAMKELPAASLDSFARLLAGYLLRTAASAGMRVRTVQLDCDWTPSTRDPYFSLLRRMQALLPGKTLTCTIRLHQVKYPATTGVPPVSRGMLMCYNIGRLERRDRNSIYDPEDAAAYLPALPAYPLPLDYALPVFCWTKLYRHGRLARLLTGTRMYDSLPAGSYRQQDPRTRVLLRSGFHEKTWMGSGDALVREAAGPEVLGQAAGQLEPYVRQDRFGVILYDWSDASLNQYQDAQINQTFGRFR